MEIIFTGKVRGYVCVCVKKALHTRYNNNGSKDQFLSAWKSKKGKLWKCIIIVEALPWGGTSQTEERRHQNINHVSSCVCVCVYLVVVFLLLNGALKMELFYIYFMIIINPPSLPYDTLFFLAKPPIIHAKQLLMSYALQHFSFIF